VHFEVEDDIIRNISALTCRLPSSCIRQLSELCHDTPQLCQMELDSHAEQCCVSEQCALIIHNLQRPVTAYGYDGGKGKMLDMVDAVVSYRDPPTGDIYMLIINQALLVPGLLHPLLCNNQLRMNDIRVNDEPKHLVLEQL